MVQSIRESICVCKTKCVFTYVSDVVNIVTSILSADANANAKTLNSKILKICTYNSSEEMAAITGIHEVPMKAGSPSPASVLFLLSLTSVLALYSRSRSRSFACM